MEKCDLVIGASTHYYERYIHPSYGETSGALCLNSSAVPRGTPNGYIECFVFDTPPRLVTIFQDCDNQTLPMLRYGRVSHAVRWTTYWSYVKRIGQVSDSISWMSSSNDWDAFPSTVESPEDAFHEGWNLM